MPQVELSSNSVNGEVSARRFRIWLLVWAALFALAHTQSPEYFSNQHHYYLHGFAQAGVGNLDQDWLSNTKDPTPVYSWLVATIYRTTGPFTFHVIYFLLLMAYFESVRRIILSLPGVANSGPAQLLFLAIFVLTHAAILRVASVHLLGADYPWFLQAGLAAQYMLGPGLQPSAFGVLLMVSLAAFVSDRPLLAASLAATAAVLHSTYLLPAALMTLGYVFVLARERRTWTGLICGAIAMLIVAPILIFNSQTFLAGNSEQFREAQRIFARVRIPHHTQFERWFDWVAGVQIGIMLLALTMIRKSRLFVVLLLPTILSIAISIVQVLTQSDSLALLFPWRISVLLMPLSIAILASKLALFIAGSFMESRILSWFGIAVMFCAAAGGVFVMAGGRGYYTNDAEIPLLEHIRQNKQRGDSYLIPVKFPTLKKESPAAASKTFAPPVRVGAVGIPVDLQRFRLWAEAPIYIDFKAPPYAPDEVIEWHCRMSNAERWYSNRDWDSTGIWQEVKDAGITHVITTTDKDVKCQRLMLTYGDENYRLYRITEP